MPKKSLIAFLITFTISYGLVKSFLYTLTKRQEKIDYEQSLIIQSTVNDRFSLFLELPLSIGMLGSEYFTHKDLYKEKYGEFITKLLLFNKDILGLNLVNEEGRIIQVFPPETNPNARGKITQNYQSIKKSYEQNESYWLSPPFKLYQGKQGFVFYIPIKNSKLRGWFAPVISAELFDEKFKLANFLKTYDVIIKDTETNLPYFETGLEPQDKTKVYEKETDLYGRKVKVLSWRKLPIPHLSFPWFYSFLFSIGLGLVAVVIMKLLEQRRKARNQLEDIGTVLQLTSKEALSKLIDLQNDFYKVESTENIQYITNLIEQIDLLQTMSHTGEGLDLERHKLLPLLEKVLSSLQDISEKKKLNIKFNQEHFKDIEIEANAWLIQNTVICNILTHSIIFADSGTSLVIDYKQTPETQFITFRTENIHQNRPDSTPITSDRRIEVARKVLQIYQGDLFLQYDLGGGMIIRILLPHPR